MSTTLVKPTVPRGSSDVIGTIDLIAASEYPLYASTDPIDIPHAFSEAATGPSWHLHQRVSVLTFSEGNYLDIYLDP